MSISRMQAVWQKPGSLTKGLARFLLVAIADNASDDGFAWPGQDYLHEKTSVSKRHITRLVKELHETGELWVEQHYQDGGKTHYILTIGLSDNDLVKTLVDRCAKPKDEAKVIVTEIRERLNAWHKSQAGGDVESTPGVDSESGGGRRGVRGGMTQSLPNPHEPPNNPQNNNNEDSSENSDHITTLCNHFLEESECKAPSNIVKQQTWEADLSDIFTVAAYSPDQTEEAKDLISVAIEILDDGDYMIGSPGSLVTTCENEAARRKREAKSNNGLTFPTLPSPDLPPPEPSSPVDTLWVKTQLVLRGQMTQATYNAIIKDTRLRKVNGSYTVYAASTASKEWLENRLKPIVTHALASTVGEPVEVGFGVRGN